MPFGCFGKRKKQERIDKPCEKPDSDGTKNNATDGVDKPAEDSSAEVNEVITVARTHSLHASAPNSVEHRHTTIGIQKSATLARYDFLRKSDYTNTADRWAALKQQYLEAPHAGQNGSAGSGGGPAVKRAAMSLPRQFAPPSSSSSVVRFSQWFYERQTMEVDARREFHEREEKTRKRLDGVEQNSIPEECANSRAEAVADNGSVKPAEVDKASNDNASETAALETHIGEDKASEADVREQALKSEDLPQDKSDEKGENASVSADHSSELADGRGAENNDALENRD